MALTAEDAKVIREAIIKFCRGIKKDIAIESPFNKTKNGRIVAVSPTGYTVEIENKRYPGIQAINTNQLRENDIVVCSLPNNQMSQMYIVGKLVGRVDASGGVGAVADVQVNNSSIVVNGVAYLATKGTYNALTNKLVTESDLPNVPAISQTQNDSTTTVPSDNLLLHSSFARVYRSLTDVNPSWTSAISVTTFLQYIITNNLTNSAFVIRNENSASFSDAPKAYGQIVVFTNNPVRMLVLYNTEVGTTDTHLYRANIIRLSGNTISEIRWLEIMDNSITSNPNLFINSNFAINQLGQESYTTTSTKIVSVDRTATARSTIVPQTGGGIQINIASGGTNPYIQQILENATSLVGEYLTLSVSINGTIYTHQVTTVVPSADSTTVYYNKNFTWGSYNMNLQLTKYNTASVGSVLQVTLTIANPSNTIVNWWKLEKGRVATMYVPPIPSEELIKCQRYIRVDRYYSRALNTYSLYAAYVKFNVEMRTTPTQTIYGVNASGVRQSTAQTVYDIDANSNISLGRNPQYITKYGCLINSGGVFTAGHGYMFDILSNAEFV